MTQDPTSWITASAALFAVLGLAVIAARLARLGGFGHGVPGRRLRIEESIALDSRRRVLLLRCDGREWLLLTGGAQDLVISGPEAAE